MTTHRVLRTTLALTAAALLATACKKDSENCDTNPTAPGCVTETPGGGGGSNGLRLAVSVRYDQASFPTTGEFDLLLVPSDSQGNLLLDRDWTITDTLSSPTTGGSPALAKNVESPDTRPFAAALLVDNTSSMQTNDPNRVRAAAAQEFWQTLFQARAGSQASLLYFGSVPGGTSATPGFTRTHLLQGWTPNTADLAGKLDTLSIGTGSTLYTSGIEVAQWIDSTTSKTDLRRALVLLTDGTPNSDSQNAQTLIAAANAANVKIYAIGLGTGSDRSSKGTTAAIQLLQELASGTGGLYAGVGTAQELTPVLQALASSSTSGVLVARFKISPAPASGTQVAGKVYLTNTPLGVVFAPWQFVAP
ncbi:MAG TPA: VWA domain-containing protein [Gemmatimonadales bacterium]|nr:VWA domain-containing protein [Gemmatimonadales bacterium]